MNDEDAVAAWERQLLRDGLARATRYRYTWAVQTWVDSWLVWPDATPKQVDEFLDRRQLSAKSRYWWLAVLHRFYDWAVEEGLATADPTRKLRRPKVPQAKARPLSTEEIAMVLLATPRSPRRTAIVLMRYAGLRCGEVSRLRWRDVDEQAGRIIVAGKGDKSRWVPIGPRLAVELPERAGLRDPVLGVCWTPPTVSHYVGVHLRACGVAGTAHQLRHTFATALYAETGDPFLVQKVLGHVSSTTTQVYVRVPDERIVAAVGKVG